MRDEELVREAKRLIDTLAATPRFAGSPEEARAREFCASELRSAAFETAETAFDFSEWPGRWGIPLIAAGLLLSLLLVAAAATRSVQLAGPVWLMTYLLGERILISRRQTATLQMQSLRSRSVNLEAKRGEEPRVWLVAHLDSKSQSIPMLVRVASHFALIVVSVLVVAMVFLLLWGAVRSVAWGWIATAGVVAALPSLFCFVGNKSRGALDNATGVAAVLLAMRLASPDKSFGVLITSGEELDLAGARAWASTPRTGLMVINCDTIDDDGVWRCMSRNRPHKVGMAAEKAAKKLGLALRMGSVIPGILTDGIAFEAAGLQSVTLSRGTVRTLARLHTSGDIPDRLNGSGTAAAARILAQMVEELA